PRPTAHLRIERRETVRVGGRPSGRRRGRPNPRRVRFHQGLRRREVIPRPARDRDLRRHIGDPEVGHRSRGPREVSGLGSPFRFSPGRRRIEEGRCAAWRPNGLCLRPASACEMQTQVLYMEDRIGQDPDPCYLREFDANVLETGPDFVILDRTAFYAEGGGQPYDTGTLSWSGQEAKVLRVTKEKGVIRHHVDRLPPVGPVHGTIDWDRRYAHMRYHTSQHILSGLVWKIPLRSAGSTSSRNGRRAKRPTASGTNSGQSDPTGGPRWNEGDRGAISVPSASGSHGSRG